MNKQLRIVTSMLLGIGVTGALAQTLKTKDDVAELRQSLHGLKWKSVDYDALSTLDRCRALTLLDHALTEIGAVATAEADLMSQYVELQDLGVDFASSQTAETAPRRSYEDGQKTAAALLRGPMAESRYATMYAGSDETDLKASLHLHESGSRRKWRQFSESVQHVRSMSAFLKSKERYQGYLVWANAESDRRQQEHEQTMAENRAALHSRSEQADENRTARARELAEQRQQEQESRLAQQAIYAQSAANAPGDVVQNYDDGDDRYPNWYPNWYPNRYYRRPLSPHVRRWHRNAAHQDRAREHTNKRLNNWHRSSGAGRRRGGRP